MNSATPCLPLELVKSASWYEELARYLEREDLFEIVARYPGWEPENERVLRRYRGRTAARAQP